jgi:hypothetical protein
VRLLGELIPHLLPLSLSYSNLRVAGSAPGRSKAGIAGGGRRRKGTGPFVVSRFRFRCRSRPSCHSLGSLPSHGWPDLGEIWTVGLAAVALWLLWSELRVEEVTATSPNNFPVACYYLAPAAPVFPLRSPSGLGGEGSCGRNRASKGSGGSRSSSTARVRGAGRPLVVSAPPSSPLSVSLGGEGKGDLAGLHACSSVFFFKRGHCFPYCPAVTPTHLAGRGGEDVAWSLLYLVCASAGLLWESLEFWLSTTHLPRRRHSATMIRRHRDDRAGLAVLAT